MEEIELSNGQVWWDWFEGLLHWFPLDRWVLARRGPAPGVAMSSEWLFRAPSRAASTTYLRAQSQAP